MRIPRGVALLELLVAVAILALFTVVLIPRLGRSKVEANESSAIASLKTLVTAEEQYRSAGGGQVYGTLSLLSGSSPPYID